MRSASFSVLVILMACAACLGSGDQSTTTGGADGEGGGVIGGCVRDRGIGSVRRIEENRELEADTSAVPLGDTLVADRDVWPAAATGPEDITKGSNTNSTTNRRALVSNVDFAGGASTT